MLLTLLAIVCVLGLLLVAAMVAVSDRDLLVEVAPDGPGTTLPAGRAGAEDVDALRFGLAFRGYRMDEVDRSLARLAQELAERDARIAQLEGAIADAVGTAVDQVEARIAVDHAQQAEEAERAEAAAELAAAREEVGPPAQDEGEPASTGAEDASTVSEADEEAEQRPAAPQQPAGGLAAVAAWGPITTTAVSAPWVRPSAEAPPVEAPAAEAETPEAEQEPAGPASAPLVAPAPHAPPWPAAEPTHPEPLVPDSALEPDSEPDSAPDSAPDGGPASGPDREPADAAAGLLDFPEVVPPPQAAADLPDADADAVGGGAPSAYRREDDEERGIT